MIVLEKKLMIVLEKKLTEDNWNSLKNSNNYSHNGG